MKKSHYDLQHEIVTFGPRMAHDYTSDALAYAVKFAYPPKNIAVSKDGIHRKKQKNILLHNQPIDYFLIL